MYKTSNSDSLHGQGHYGFKWHFLHLSTGRIYETYGVFKNVSLNTKTSVL